jgi:superfamily II DNA or RNA helicase
MKLEDLLLSGSAGTSPMPQVGGVCVVNSNLLDTTARQHYAKRIAALEGHGFWKAAETQGAYRPQAGLWAPQRRAVAVSAAYLVAARAGKTRESALIKMPTGTGKTAVIATLACALPDVERTLIITPRRALASQMLADVHWRFWKNFKLRYTGSKLEASTAAATPTESESTKIGVLRLLPTTASDLYEKPQPKRLIVVSTFAALEQTLRLPPPAHRLSGASPSFNDGSPAERERNLVNQEVAKKVHEALSKFDLVIVDEGHYEPAFVWSQCVRALGCPTILFSATPYRNDFKFFSIQGNFAFNLGFSEATEQKLIRPVEFAAESDVPKGESAAAFVDGLHKYYESIVAKKPWSKVGPKPRVIVRIADYESLVVLRTTIERRLKQRCVLIHHRITKNDEGALEFGSATAALASGATAGVRLWLHQWMLLEGVDEKEFSTIAIFQSFRSSRQIVQQIGRVLRFFDYSGSPGEVATVYASANVLADLKARFDRYGSYEDYFNENPGLALKQEARLPSVMLKEAAPYQYLFGDFRERLGLDESEKRPTLADFKVPFRMSIFRNVAKHTLDALAELSQEAMGLEDRYDVRIVKPMKGEPQNARLIMYLTWKNSELLTRHSLPVWDLGVMVLVVLGPRVFLQDSKGLVVDLEKLGFEAEPPENLRRLIPATTPAARSRVAQASAVGLDLSESAIRSATVRMHDLSSGFYDLSQGSQALRALRAYMYGGKTSVSRYLSIDRSSVSDTNREADNRNQGIGDFVSWATLVAKVLDSSGEPSVVFDQFAKTVAAPKDADALPRNILFDFLEDLENDPQDLGWDAAKVALLRDAELCLDIDDAGNFKMPVGGGSVEGTIEYEITGSVHRRGKYLVKSEGLDQLLLDPATTVGEPASLVSLINKEQAFRVITQARNLTYANKVFYATDLNIDAVRAGHGRGTPLESVVASKWMSHVVSEKGGGTPSQWVEGSIFGGVYAHFGLPKHGKKLASLSARPIRANDAALASELDTFDIVVCDDGGKERADFMLVSEDPPRVVFVHAKVNDTAFSLNSMQIVGRQALAGLAFMTRGHRDLDRATWWESPWQTDDHLAIPHRILRSKDHDLVKTWLSIQEALLSSRFNKEIWIWVGRSLSRKSFVDKLTAVGGPKPESLQMAYYLGSLQTAAARANVRTRILCSP